LTQLISAQFQLLQSNEDLDIMRILVSEIDLVDLSRHKMQLHKYRLEVEEEEHERVMKVKMKILVDVDGHT
jgi:hypothetical protein